MLLRFMCHRYVCKFLALFHMLRWVVAFLAVLVAALLVGSLAVSVIENADARDDAIEAVELALNESETQRRFSARRIDKLIDANTEQSAQLGELREDVRLLRAQLQAVGQTPIVEADRAQAPTADSGSRAQSPSVPGGPASTPQPAPTPQQPTTTTTAPPPAPAPECAVRVLTVCVEN